ncbi:hypothetical protein EWM64_g5872 [Hericium alpestre]|uniref:Uncharacterized protein n=1 Tax=Hericium alpestre TaxID=135208 RepID=A0A4Y9ZTA8_9AGAM|nr:hypothetical protein EWM64_g5872 [Hericium alpestre]
MCKKVRAAVGRDCFGYWEYFSEEGADKMIEQNMDSFVSLFFIDPSEGATEHLCTFGGTKAWIESNRQGPLPATGPLQWYVVNIAGHNMADDAKFPEAAYKFAQPMFFGGNANEPVCLPALGLASVKAYAMGPVTYREFDSNH